MSRIGVLQGTYLGIYVSNSCLYWNLPASPACAFCTTGRNVGDAEESRKKVEDVVEVARAARDHSGSIFTHLNTGYHFEDVDKLEALHGLRQCEPFVKAIRAQVGGFIGVQAVPVPRQKFAEYDDLIAAGTDHFSFCYEFEDPEVFASLCPGQGPDGRPARVLRGDGVHGGKARRGESLGRDHRGPRADRRDETRDRPHRERGARSRPCASSARRSGARWSTCPRRSPTT